MNDISLDDLVPTESKYLTKDDVGEKGIDLTIRGFKREKVGQSNDADERAIMGFVEDVKPMVLNKTNMRRLKTLLSATMASECRGKKVNVYNDPLIEFGGQIVGGIRIRAPQGTPAPDDTFGDDVPF